MADMPPGRRSTSRTPAAPFPRCRQHASPHWLPPAMVTPGRGWANVQKGRLWGELTAYIGSAIRKENVRNGLYHPRA
jgi:hypothetical protein